MKPVGEILKPRIAPRDAIDALISAAWAVTSLLLLVGIPWLAVFSISGSEVVAWLTAAAIYWLILLLAVQYVIVTPEGLYLKRAIGSPRFLAWADIESVKEVERKELILHGWIWPLFPAREMTPSFTSVGHYRIEFGQRWIYYPPADKVAFESLVSRGRGAVV